MSTADSGKATDLPKSRDTSTDRQVPHAQALTRLFYQTGRRVTQMNALGGLRVIWVQQTIIAQQSPLGGQHLLLQTDSPNSILGRKHQVALQPTAYSPYGCSSAGSQQASPAFNGQWVDPLLKGYMLGNGYRLYSTALMRFCSADFISPFGGGGINTYAYCKNDPINHADPTGHIAQSGAIGPLDALASKLLLPSKYSKSNKSILHALMNDSELRIHGHYFDKDSKNPEWFRMKAMESKNGIEIKYVTAQTQAVAIDRVVLGKSKLPAGRYMGDISVMISSINHGERPRGFSTLKSHLPELNSFNLDTFDMGHSDIPTHDLNGFIRPLESQNSFLHRHFKAPKISAPLVRQS